jgi:hypothetical protein
VGGHSGAAACAESAHPLAQVFLEKGTDLGAHHGLGVVGTGISVHAATQRGLSAKTPQERGKDAATTRAACEKYALVPTSVMNFLEGTRCTPAKQKRQQSPYRHLLKPKAGGVSLALDAMGKSLVRCLTSPSSTRKGRRISGIFCKAGAKSRGAYPAA